MKRLVLVAWLGFAGIAWAQQSGVPPAGDVFNVNTPGGGAETPSAALQNLYQLAAQMTADPSSGYDPKTTRWPHADQVQKQWAASVSAYGNKMTQAERRQMVPCAAHMNAAIDSMERGYRIHITQKTWIAQKSAQDLYARGRAEFAMCTGGDTFANNSQRTPAPTEGNQTGKPGSNPQSNQPGGNPQSNQPGGSGGQNGGNNPGGPPQHGGVGQTGGNTPPNTQGSPTNPGSGPTTFPICGDELDWVQNYRAEGVYPPLRYQVGFNQGISGCLRDQCTMQNLAIAIWAAAFPQARALLAGGGIAGAAANLISTIVHPPGFSQNPDPYERGRDEGSRLCNWMLKMAVPLKGNAKQLPLVGPQGKIYIPPGFSFYEVVKTMPKWLPKINPEGCDRNCAYATENTVRVFFGQAPEAAPVLPAGKPGWTDGMMEKAIGRKFEPRGDAQEMNTALEKMPEGTVGVIGAEYQDPNLPGHFFGFAKANNTLQYWDGQQGYDTLSGGWEIFRWMVVGNPLNPE